MMYRSLIVIVRRGRDIRLASDGNGAIGRTYVLAGKRRLYSTWHFWRESVGRSLTTDSTRLHAFHVSQAAPKLLAL